MLTPYDFDLDALTNEGTRAIMETVFFEHGGTEYDEKYPRWDFRTSRSYRQ